MKTFSVPTRGQVSPESQVLFDVLKKRVGKVPNLYATMGYSSFALANVPVDFPLAEPLKKLQEND